MAAGKPISLNDKIRIISNIEEGTKQSHISEQLSIAKSTVSTIWKNGIIFNKICGEERAVSLEFTENWLDITLPKLLRIRSLWAIRSRLFNN